ncbi:DUF6131 family protein [Streptomyces sp. HC307]
MPRSHPPRRRPLHPGDHQDHLVVVGIILRILGSVGYAVGGRRHYW